MGFIDNKVNNIRFISLAAVVAIRAPRSRCKGKPVIFFNTSTRLGGTSLNAGFAAVTAWALRLAGVPVLHFVCQAGMSRCVLGTDPDHPEQKMPCGACVRQSRILTSGAASRFFAYRRDENLAAALQPKTVNGLMQVIHEGLPLGALVLPGLRWRLRVHHLEDNETTRSIFREFILSAWNVAQEFDRLLEENDPQVVVLFNGQFFPEAVARFQACRRGIRTVTHEVGLQPFSAYFTEGEATAYPITIPDSFEMNAEQDARLEAYLENRFQGRFSMAGVQFWPEMKGLDETFLNRAAGFQQIVPVFTNVVFDTSQPHSNVVFPDMFAWLDVVLESMRLHPETLFVLRAHPDESRSGKAARESVAMWVERNKVDLLPNVVFISPDEYLSSYELIQRARFVMIYNSTIGLEASIMGRPVLCAGKARFTQYPTVSFPDSQPAYRRQLESFLRSESLTVPVEFRRNARRFLYYQLFRTSLPFGEFLEATRLRGYVRLKKFRLEALRPEASATVCTLLDGLLHGGDFLLKEK
jgi:hypothetical protein